MIWTPDNVRRIIMDTAGSLLRTPPMARSAASSEPIDLHNDLGLDSLRRMELAAHLNEFFGLFNTTTDNYLLAGTSLEHWTNCILRARRQQDDAITFRTSGTSGASRPVQHSLDALLAEARFLTELLPQPAQLVSTVPAHHIYGFIYTILLPALWDCPVLLLGDIVLADLGADTVVIGTPFTWEFIHRSIPVESRVVCGGVTSTGPISSDLFNQLRNRGILLTEIYGSSDTGGIGYRTQPDTPFTLFSHLSVVPDEPGMLYRSDCEITYAVPDRLEWVAARQLRVLGRLDEAIQIAGVNVYPANIRQRIRQCPLVDDCEVYAKAEGGISKLYGTVRLIRLNEINREGCQRWIREHLSAPETPSYLYFY